MADDDTLRLQIEADVANLEAGVQRAYTEMASFRDQVTALGTDTVKAGESANSYMQRMSALDAATQGLTQSQKQLSDQLGQLSEAHKVLATTTGDGAQQTSLLGEAFSGILGPLAAAVAGFASLKTVLEGINFADAVRDMPLSIDAVSHSTTLGAQAMSFFTEAEEGTRATTMELAKLFRDDLPLAMAKGMDPKQFEEATVAMANFATATGQDIGRIDTAFRQILGGRVTGTNPILSMLGISRQDVTAGNVYLDEVIAKMQQVGGIASEMGQTMASSWAHVKEDIAMAFADGFNSARSSAQSAYSSIRDIFLSQGMHDSIASIGTAIADILPVVARAAEAFSGAFEIAINAVKEEWDRFVYYVNDALSKLAKGGAELASSMHMDPSIVNGLWDISNATFQAAMQAKAGMEQSGNAVLEGMSKVSDAFSSGSKAAKDYGGSVENIIAPHVQLGVTAKDTSKSLLEDADQVDNLIARLKELGDAPSRTMDPLAAAIDRVDKTFDNLGKQADQLEEKLLLKGDAAAADNLRGAFDAMFADYKAQAEDIARQDYWQKIGDQAQKAFDSADKSLQKYIADLQNIPAQFGASGLSQLQALEGQLEDLKTLFAAGLISPEQFSEMNDFIQQQAQLLTQEDVKAAQAYGEELKKQAAESTRLLQSDIQGIFDGFLQGGTKGLDTALRDIGKNAGKEFSQMAVQGLAKLFGGTAPQEGDYSTWGGPYANFATAQNQYNQGQASTMTNLGAGIGIAASAYNSITTPGMSVGMGALQGAAAGASAGWIGAVIGAVVGGLAGALAPSSSQNYQYGQPGYQGRTGATFGVAGTTNLSDAATQEYLDQINQTVQNFNNKFVKLMLSFGPQFANMVGSLLANENFSGMEAGTPGGGQWGTIGQAASKNWAAHMQTWIQEGLPHMMEDYFWQPLADGLEHLGFSQSLIDQLHHMQSTMAPQDWITYVSGLVGAVQAMQKELDKLGSNQLLSSSTVRGGQGADQNVWAAVQIAQHGTFAQQMADTDSQIMQLAQSLSSLTGQDQVDAMNQINQMMEQRYQKEIAYIAQIQSDIQSVNDSFGGTIRNFQLQLIGDQAPGGANTNAGRQAQENYLRSYLQNLYGQQAMATDPQTVMALASQINQVINQMVSLGQQMGPQAAQQYLQWGIQAAQSEQTTITKHLQQMAQAAADSAAQMHNDLTNILNAILAGNNALTNTPPAPPPPGQTPGGVGPNRGGGGGGAGPGGGPGGGQGPGSGGPPGGLYGPYYGPGGPTGTGWLGNSGGPGSGIPDPGATPYLMGHSQQLVTQQTQTNTLLIGILQALQNTGKVTINVPPNPAAGFYSFTMRSRSGGG